MGVVYNKFGGGNAEFKELWSGSSGSVTLDLSGYDYIALQISDIPTLFLATKQNNIANPAGYAGMYIGNGYIASTIYLSDTQVSLDTRSTSGTTWNISKIYGISGL